MRRLFLAILLSLSALVVAMHSGYMTPPQTLPISEYVIKSAYIETGGQNAVTSVYLFYRYYDTLFEALMLLFSIIGVIYMSVHEGDEYHD